MISAGQGGPATSSASATWAPTARSLYPVVGLAALGRALADLGAPVDVGAGVEAALEVLVASRDGGAPRDAAALRPAPRRVGRGGDRPARPSYGDDAALYCGGTELLLLLKLGFAAFGHLVDVEGDRGARAASRPRTATLVIGAAVTHRELERSALVRERLPALAAMERSVANLRVREAGTLGGNLCFSDPHSDPATFLLAADAEVGAAPGRRAGARLPLRDVRARPVRDGARARASCSSPCACRRRRRRAPASRTASSPSTSGRRRRSPAGARVPTASVAEARVAVGSVGAVAGPRAARPRRCCWRARAGDDRRRPRRREAAAAAAPRSRTRTARPSTSASSCACWSRARCGRRWPGPREPGTWIRRGASAGARRARSRARAPWPPPPPRARRTPARRRPRGTAIRPRGRCR